MSNDTFYNKTELNPPPLLSFKLCCKNSEIAGNKINDIFLNAIDILKDQNNLHNESATLSRLIYRWKRRLRNDKGFKALEKVNRSLLQYLALDMLSILEKVQALIEDEYGPSKQVMEWVLVRLQGFSALFDNIYKRCVEAVKFLQWRFHTGHMWMVALIGTAVISRIWVISVYLVKESCEWYSQLKQMLPILQPSLHPWLPAGFVPPEDLTVWLENPNYLARNENMESSTLYNILNKIGLPGVSVENKLLNDVKLKGIDLLRSETKSELLKEDLGEVVLRKDFATDSSFVKVEMDVETIIKDNGDYSSSILGFMKEDKSINVKEQKNKSSKRNISTNSVNSLTNIIKSITSRDKLIRFVKREKVIRKSNESDNNNGDECKCYTGKLDKMQWRMFQRFIKENVEEIDKYPMKRKLLLSNVKKKIKLWLS